MSEQEDDESTDLAETELEVEEEGDDIPLATKRAFDRSIDRFAKRLAERTGFYQDSRNSAEPADSDVESAYDDLMARPAASTRKRVVGDTMMVAGGFFLSCASESGWLPVAGLLLTVGGIYVREFNE